MSLLLVIALQSAGPATIIGRPSCDPAENDNEIVVCALGDDAEQFRIPEAMREEQDDHSPRRVQIDLGNGATAEISGEQGGAGGFVSQRIMTGVKIPF